MSGQAALAVRQAAPPSRAAPITLQRSCTCEQEGSSCARCAGKGKPLQRLATAGSTPGSMPSSIDTVLRSNGQPDAWSMDASEKRAAQIKSGEKDFVLDQPVTRGDIDEPLAVGAPGIKPQRAVDRAMDPHNRQFLDPATNRRTKHVSTSSRDVARGRDKLGPVSLKDEPNALFNRRFDETHEMSKIFDEAVNRVHNKGELSPTQLKNRINREISNIIKEGNSAEAKTVREVLTSKGFVFKERVGWVATTEVP